MNSIKFLTFLSYLPLLVFHFLGICLGWGVFFSSSSFRQRMKKNCCEYAGFNQNVLYPAVGEFGKSITELGILWFRPLHKINELIVSVKNRHILDTIIQHKKPVIFLTPHLGSFEILNLYASSRFPMTILYRSPKLKFLEAFMLHGRQKGLIRTATTDLKGVRQLIKALKQGESIGMLPDQVPSNGDGIWSPFFNHDAYTMNLPIKLAIQHNVPIVFAYAKRLSWGRGYILDFKRFIFDANQPIDAIVLEMNQHIETIIRQFPEQYLWSYNRYKQPKQK